MSLILDGTENLILYLGSSFYDQKRKRFCDFVGVIF